MSIQKDLKTITEKISRIIITGASGPIGMTVVEFCIKAEIYIVCITRSNNKYLREFSKSEYVDIIICDMENILCLIEKVQPDFDAFIHLAWSNTDRVGRDDINAQLENIQFSLWAAEVAKKLNCKRYIGIGSQAEYGFFNGVIDEGTVLKPQNAYGTSKVATYFMIREKCKELNIPFNWVRIFSVYGPYQHNYTVMHYVIDSLLNNEVPSLTSCEQKWDFLYSEDAVIGLMHVISSGKENEVYCLGYGESRTLKEFVECAKASIDKDSNIDYNRDEVGYSLEVSTRKINDHTSFLPLYTFETGINQTIKWYKKNT